MQLGVGLTKKVRKRLLVEKGREQKKEEKCDKGSCLMGEEGGATYKRSH